MSGPRTASGIDIEVQAPRDRPRDIISYARERIRQLFPFAHEPVLGARVRLTRHSDPAVADPCIAQVNLNVNGRPLRAHASAPSAKEAVDRVHDRLKQRLRHGAVRAAGSWEDRRGASPSTEPHEWRHSQPATHRPRHWTVPMSERQIVRHKSFALHPCDVDHAAADLEDLDYDFYLFTEIVSGQDSVLYRAEDNGYRLAQVEPRPDVLAGQSLGATLSPQSAPVLDTDEAIARMAFLDEPFLFYLDGERGRAAVLYCRSDGHYGLITPAE